MVTTGITLSNEAQELFEQISPKIEKEVNDIMKIAVAVLVWGPAPSAGTPYSEIRVEVKDKLIRDGHLAKFSEDLYDTSIDIPPRAQQVAQAKYFEVIISIPESHGSVAEVHDFLSIEEIRQKMIIFINEEFNDGYSNKSIKIFDTINGCRIFSYDGVTQIKEILKTTEKKIHKYQILKYLRKANARCI